MSIVLPKIYPITDTAVSGLTHAEQVRAFASGGATLVQVRDKTASSSELYVQTCDAVNAASKANVRLIVNDRADIALMAGAAGVHLGQDDLPPDAARRVLGDKAVIGLSTHNFEQAVRSRDLPIDYIAFGPVFKTDTKANHAPVVGLRSLESVRRAVGELPIVAIGGITPERLRAVFDAGADSAAMISALLKDPSRLTDIYREITRAVSNDV